MWAGSGLSPALLHLGPSPRVLQLPLALGWKSQAAQEGVEVAVFGVQGAVCFLSAEAMPGRSGPRRVSVTGN